MPKAILKTRMVDGLMGTPAKPMTPAVIIKGSKLGISEMITIRNERKRYAMNNAISTIAKVRDKIRFFTKYLVPFKKSNALPVMLTSNLSEGKILLICSWSFSSIASIRSVSTSFI